MRLTGLGGPHNPAPRPPFAGGQAGDLLPSFLMQQARPFAMPGGTLDMNAWAMMQQAFQAQQHSVQGLQMEQQMQREQQMQLQQEQQLTAWVVRGVLVKMRRRHQQRWQLLAQLLQRAARGLVSLCWVANVWAFSRVPKVREERRS